MAVRPPILRPTAQTAPKDSLDSARRVHKQELQEAYRIPSDADILTLRDKIKTERRETRQSQPLSHSVSIRGGRYRKLLDVKPTPISMDEVALAHLLLSPNAVPLDDGLHAFVDERRDIFLVQLVIDTRREELDRIAQYEREEADRLRVKEAQVTAEREQFQAFLEADGKTTLDYKRRADDKAKQVVDCGLKIRQLGAQLATLRNDIVHDEERLSDCEGYRAFLEGLTPREWRRDHPGELYFRDPKQLVAILEQGIEANRLLAGHLQDAEEQLDRLRFEATSQVRNHEDSSVRRRDERIRFLEELRQFEAVLESVGSVVPSYGTGLSDAEMVELTDEIISLHGELPERYEPCGNDIVIMLTRIEGTLQNLSRKLAACPRPLLNSLSRQKALRRREDERLENQAAAKKLQDDKMRRAIELALQPVRRKEGRPLNPRTLPAFEAAREIREEEERRRQLEETRDEALFFGPIDD